MHPRKLASCADCQSRHQSVLCDLESRLLTQVDAAKTSNTYAPRQVIFYEGNQPFGLHCISSGKVKIYKTDANGNQHITRIVGTGDIMGYRCLLANECYTATAETLEEARICFIDKATFFSIIERDPKTALNVMSTLARGLRHAEEQMSTLVHKNVRERLAELLLTLNARYGRTTRSGATLDISLTREEMAEIIGTTQESVIRLISEFRESRLIEVAGRNITLLDIPALTRTANIID